MHVSSGYAYDSASSDGDNLIFARLFLSYFPQLDPGQNINYHSMIYKLYHLDMGNIDMPYFTVSVVLHNAVEGDYDTLNKKMIDAGFTRFIGREKVYKLPEGEFNFENGAFNKQEVADLALKVAEQIRFIPSILVTESGGRTWRNLDLK